MIRVLFGLTFVCPCAWERSGTCRCATCGALGVCWDQQVWVRLWSGPCSHACTAWASLLPSPSRPFCSVAIPAMVLKSFCILLCLPFRGAVLAVVQRLISTNGHILTVCWFFCLLVFKINGLIIFTGLSISWSSLAESNYVIAQWSLDFCKRKVLGDPVGGGESV